MKKFKLLVYSLLIFFSNSILIYSQALDTAWLLQVMKATDPVYHCSFQKTGSLYTKKHTGWQILNFLFL